MVNFIFEKEIYVKYILFFTKNRLKKDKLQPINNLLIWYLKYKENNNNKYYLLVCNYKKK